MKFKSALLTSGSGSLGGMTMSHNRGGYYLRARTIPTDPSTQRQIAVRTSLSTLVTSWMDTLTSTQREDWATYAANTPVTNVMGDPVFLTGQQQYIRSGTPRLQHNETLVNPTLVAPADAPVIFNTGDFNTAALVFSASPGAGNMALEFDATEGWVDVTGSTLLLYQSRPVSPSINYYKGPFALASAIVGDATTPPTSEHSWTSPFTLTAGQKVFLRARLSRADGRLSAPIVISSIAV